MRVFSFVCTLALLPTLCAAPELAAQVRVNPTGVNVNMMNPTTVFLTFGGVRTDLRPSEAYWCGELVSAAPDVGMRCRPGTIFGQLPARYDRSRQSGTAAFTDIMSIPTSVARRAWQDARRGEVPSFFYVRRFESMTGGRDEFVAVTCRPSAGGARTPFALTDVRVKFDGRDEVQFVPSGQVLPPFAARIAHNGTGRLVGRWEVVLPGEEGPSAFDLLTEASLPVEERWQQRRFVQVERFNLFVPPGGTVTLPGPDPTRLPTAAGGSYLVLLRIEATDDREGDSNLGSVGAGSGVAHAGAVAGFPMPVLRYVVAGDGTTGASQRSRLAPLRPRNGAHALADSVVRLVWSADREASLYRVEVEDDQGATIVQALVPAAQTHYAFPGRLIPRARSVVRWRVSAVGSDGQLLRRTSWWTLRSPP